MRRTALIGLGAPVLLRVLGVLVFLAIRADLPDPVVTHRSRSGPDGFTARDRVVLTVPTGPAVGLLLGAGADRAHRSGAPLKFLPSTGCGWLLAGQHGGRGQRWGYPQVVPSTVRRAGRVVHQPSPTRSTAPLRPGPTRP